MANPRIRTGLTWPQLLAGRLIKRYQRFLADVQLNGKHVVTAHCPNTGSMKGCCQPGRPVFLSAHNNPKRKLKYTWEMIRMPDSLVGINTLVPNRLIAKSIEAGEIEELSPADHIDPRYGQALRKAASQGVEVLAYDVDINLKGIRLRNQIPYRF